MTGSSKLFAVVLMVVSVTNAVTMGSDPPGTATKTYDRPAGCHEHGPTNKAPQRAKFVCCLSGHDSAMVRPALVVCPSLRSSVVVYVATLVNPSKGSSNFDLRLTSSGDPPGMTSLRI
jgi:hypothetical protein